jgi:hypothetical protein
MASAPHPTINTRMMTDTTSNPPASPAAIATATPAPTIAIAAAFT